MADKPVSNASGSLVDADLKKKLMDFLVTKRVPIKIQDPSNLIHTRTVDTFNYARITAVSPKSLPFNQSEVTVYFNYEDELFFFSAKYKLSEDLIHFTLPNSFYKIQRRENYRLEVPNHYHQEVEVYENRFAKFKIRDLSLGGCLLQTNSPLESTDIVDMELMLKLTVLDFIGEKFIAKVKSVRKNMRDGSTLIGLEFLRPNAEQKQGLQALLFKIDRYYRSLKHDE